MPETAEQDFCDDTTPELYEALLGILSKMRVNAHVSYSVTEEVAIHLWRDLERLFATHHLKVHPTKSCSYAAFWVRKLKPVSDAYPSTAVDGLGHKDVPPHEAEITDINEQVAIHLSLTLMRNCIRDNRIIRPPGVDKQIVLNAFDEVAAEYLTSEIEDGMSMGRRFDSMIYDMRFRTYGPHHLTHFLVQITRDIYRACGK